MSGISMIGNVWTSLIVILWRSSPKILQIDCLLKTLEGPVCTVSSQAASCDYANTGRLLSAAKAKDAFLKPHGEVVMVESRAKNNVTTPDFAICLPFTMHWLKTGHCLVEIDDMTFKISSSASFSNPVLAEFIHSDMRLHIEHRSGAFVSKLQKLSVTCFVS